VTLKIASLILLRHDYLYEALRGTAIRYAAEKRNLAGV
jgi:hypothetical protein